MRRALALLVAAALALPVTALGADLVQRGRELFLDGCASCHGMDARGIPQTAPDLHVAGAASADFYLRTGRMPLDVATGEQPLRGKPAYDDADIRALVAYIGSLGGPSIPHPHPERGSLSQGLRLYTENCAGCHQMDARGGLVTGGIAPELRNATPTQIAEAVRAGPYYMPRFPADQLSDRELDSIIRYVQLTKHPVDRGGWAIGHLGPIPEGLVAWLMAGTVLVALARIIGEREQE